MKVNFKKLHPEAKLPFKKHATDACFDLYATSKNDLGDGRIEYGLGFAIQIDKDDNAFMQEVAPGLIPYFMIVPRSSIHKTGLVLSNNFGVIDQDFTGEVKAVFYHLIPTLPAYNVGDRICQMQIQNTNQLEFIEVEELDDTERGAGGYGSTGTN